MQRIALILVVGMSLLLAGCSNKADVTPSASGPAASTPDSTPAAPETTAAAPAPATSELLAHSLYDSGPRASEGRVDTVQAAAGKKLFMTKGCTACHGWGKKLTGPDLKGVTNRRTAAWMEQQIMHPDVMTRTDPISHGLMIANNNLQMLNLHLTQSEAASLIVYFRQRDAAH